MDYFTRLDQIENYINKMGRVSTVDLSKKFKVSEQTIRKNLSELEKEDLITRIHGGAKKKSGFKDRLEINKASKKQLCQEVAKLLSREDVVFLDGGTTYYYLPDFVDTDLNCKFITFSTLLAQKLIEAKHKNVYLLGGLINPNTLETFSYEALEMIRQMHFNLAFFGTSNFSLEYGFTEQNLTNLKLKQVVRERAEFAAVVTTKNKFGSNAMSKLFDYSELDLLITESFDNETINQALANKIKLVQV